MMQYGSGYNAQRSLETLPEDYQHFSFQQKGYGKYLANPEFMQVEQSRQEESDIQGMPKDAGEGQEDYQRQYQDQSQQNGSRQQQVFQRKLQNVLFGLDSNSGSVIRRDGTNSFGANANQNNSVAFGSGFESGYGSVVTKKTPLTYNSSKFDNLKSILSNGLEANNGGTVVHNETTNSFGGTTRVNPAKADDSTNWQNGREQEKENVPLWKRHIEIRKAQKDPAQQVPDHNMPHKSISNMELNSHRTKSSGLLKDPRIFGPLDEEDESLQNRQSAHGSEPVVRSTAVSTFSSKSAGAEKSDSNFSSLQSGRQSPLKLFADDNYNTYTQQKFDNLIGTYNPEAGDSYSSNSYYHNSQKSGARSNDNRKMENGNGSIVREEGDSSIRILKSDVLNNLGAAPNGFQVPSRSTYQLSSNRLSSIDELPSGQTNLTDVPINDQSKLNKDEHMDGALANYDQVNGKHSRSNSQNSKGSSFKGGGKGELEFPAQGDSYEQYADELFEDVMKRGPRITSNGSFAPKKRNLDLKEASDSVNSNASDDYTYDSGSLRSRQLYGKRDSILSTNSENNGNQQKVLTKGHSRGGSKNSAISNGGLGLGNGIQSNNLNTTDTKQYNDYMQYADKIYDDFIKRGPGVASKESLNACKSKEGPLASIEVSEYTSDEPITANSDYYEQGDINRQQRWNYNGNLNSENIKNGQGILKHPQNARTNVPNFIQDVTNNMSTFGTVHLQDGNQKITGIKGTRKPQEKHEETKEPHGLTESDLINGQEEEFDDTYYNDNPGNETSEITHHFLESFIEPKLQTRFQLSAGGPANHQDELENSYILNDSHVAQSTMNNTDKSIDYDMNASFMNEISRKDDQKKTNSKFNSKQQNTRLSYKMAAEKKSMPNQVLGKSGLKGNMVKKPNTNFNNMNNSKVNFKKLLKFAPGEVEIPDKVHGMVFNKRLNKWVKASRKAPEYEDTISQDTDTNKSSSTILTSSRDDENVNALNAIADLSIISHRRDSVENGYYAEQQMTETQSTEGNSTTNNNTANNNTMMNNDITFNQLPNVSSISQVDTTFSNSKKALVSTLLDISKNKNWDLVKDINLSNKELTSLVDLNTFLPNLRLINLDNNYLRSLDDLPPNIDNISACRNKLNGLLSLKYYHDIEILNVTGNFFKTLSTFKNLSHLRHLNVSSNLVNNINSLNNSSFHNLLRLNLSNNYIRGTMNLKRFKYLHNLQELDLSNNYIDSIDGLKSLPELIIFKAEFNQLTEFEFNSQEEDTSYHKSLKKLSLIGNSLKTINLAHFRNLRVLRINDNMKLDNLKALNKLDELVINGPFKPSFSGASEMKLHDDLNYKILQEMVEHNTIKALNVANAGITSLNVLQHIALESLYCPFNSITNFQNLIEDIKFLTKLKRIDLRFNPITIEFYAVASKKRLLDIYYDKDIDKQDESLEDDDLEASNIHDDNEAKTFKDTNSVSTRNIFKGALQRKWELQDEHFVESLKSSNLNVYKKRIYYQGLMLKMFKRIKYLDGIAITAIKKREILDEFKQYFD